MLARRQFRSFAFLLLILLIAGIVAVPALSEGDWTITKDERAGEEAPTADRVDNKRPIAIAGRDQTVPAGSLVTLDGGGSTDADGDPLTYSWTWVSRPEGSAASLQNPTDVRPRFAVDVPGDYVVRLEVHDGSVKSAPSTVTINPSNSRPRASAGRNLTAAVGTAVGLDGSGSSDADGNRLGFAWRVVSRPLGSTAALTDPTSVTPTFVPDVPGAYVVQLIVDDGAIASQPAEVTVSTRNSAPTAHAGSDQTVSISSVVSLDACGSTDVDGDSLAYAWSFVWRPAESLASLDDPAAVLPTFVADQPGTYVVQLIIRDGVLASEPDTIAISTLRSAPVADAGKGLSVAVGNAVTLDGSASSDVDSDPLTFRWALMTQPADSMATLADAFTPWPSLIADRPGTYVAQLIVSDGTTDSAPATISIKTTNSPPMADAGPDQLGAPVGKELTLFGARASDPDGDLLTYWWSILARPPGSTTALNGADVSMPTFTPDVAGDYVLQFVTLDRAVQSPPDTVLVRAGQSRPVVRVLASDRTAGETGPDPGQFLFVRSGPRNAPLTLFFTVAGTATNGTDYTPSLTGSVTIPVGQSQATLTITPVDDGEVEGTETVKLRLTPNAAYRLVPASDPERSRGHGRGASSLATITIKDNDSGRPTVKVTATDAAASETGPDTGRFTFTRTGRTTSALNVRYSVGGTATGGTDYTPTLTGTVTIPAAEASTVVTITPVDDATVEGDETVVATVTADAAYGVGTPSSATVEISDNDGTRPTVTVEATDAAASETGPDAGMFTFTRTGPTTSALDVLYSVGGTATGGTDYAPTLSGTVTILAGQASAAVTITPDDDADVEGDETVVLTVTADAAYSVGTPGSATVTISDNDVERPTVTVEATDAAASETGPDAGTFTFTRTGPTTSPLDVLYGVGGTATGGTDYAPTLSGTVTILAGQASAAVTITPGDDADVEGDETVGLTVTADAAYSVGTPGTATVTISDNDVERPTVTVEATDAAASETGPDAGTFTFTRTGPTTSPLDVLYSVGGTATGGTDYAPTLSGTVTILAGQSTVDVTITPLRDNLVEDPETLVLTIGSSLDYTIGTQDAATVTIADDPAIVNATVVDADASEAGPDTGTIRFTRSGGDLASALTVDYTVGGTATNGVDDLLLTGSIAIPANESSVELPITPLADNIVEPVETVIVTISSRPRYSVGDPSAGTVNIADNRIIVEVQATDPDASEVGPDPGRFTFTRTGGDVSSALLVSFTRSGTALEDVDYSNLGSASVTISANELSATLAVAPIADAVVESDETVVVTVTSSASYTVGASGAATVTIHDAAAPPLVSVTAFDSSASEIGPDGGVFRFTRTGSTASGLTVSYTIGGTAGNGVDYDLLGTSILIPAGELSADLTVTPIVDALPEASETLVIDVTAGAGYDVGSPASATVTIADVTGDCGPEGGTLVNGATHCGAILNAGETDTWTFEATAGDSIAIHIGEVIDDNDFRPWIRLQSPTAVSLGSASGTDAAALDAVVAPVTGTYTVLVASFDSGFDGTGTYRLTMTHTPGPITISSGDDGGPLTNGALHTGDVFQGDLDVWTFTATAGDRIGLHIGEIADTDDFRPWIRLWAPNGAILGSSSGTDAAALDGVAAPVTGTYLVLVASFDSGFDGTGTYRLSMTKTPGPITVSSGDDGGPLTNGALHTGEIPQGDLDVWTFTATAGDRIGLHIGEIADTDDFRPWIRLWAPNGAILGSSSGTDAAALDGVAAPVTGTYLVLVASFDSGFDGTGTYRLTMTHTPGPITVSSGDDGGPLTNGALHTGEILQGDLDVWTFTATVGDRIGLHIGEITDNDDFRPWIRLWAPNGAILGSTAGTDAAVLDGVAAPVTGTYLVLVASFDSGFDGTGTYRLSMTKTPGPITVSSGDDGGPLTNGALHTGEIPQGDLDVWTFTATAGDRIGLHIGEIADTDDFRPWIRLWAPNGAILGSSSGTDAAALDGVAAPITGTYLVLVASFDSGFDGTGTYRLSMTKTPGPITVSSGDDGGPLTNGALHTGEILQGDLDVWTFTATVGDRIGLHIGEITDNDDFRPWIRLWAPNGAILGSTAGTDAAVLDGVAAPVTGTYLVLVASFDSGFDGTGTYRLSMTKTPGPITVSSGDDGGPLTNGALHTGEIPQGDLDVWTFTATAGDRIGLHIGEIADTDDFRPWIRLWAPNGAILGSSSGTDAAALDGVAAPVTGTYLVLVASFDSGFDGTGTYRLTMTHTPGPITVTAGDDGGAVTLGVGHTGEIVQGDLDVWTVGATAGNRITVQISQASETDDFRPWIRLWAPNGAILGSLSGLDTAAINAALAPVTGTYLILVGSFDSGVDGTGTYTLTVTRTVSLTE